MYKENTQDIADMRGKQKKKYFMDIGTFNAFDLEYI